jgi:hypothetical protein
MALLVNVMKGITGLLRFIGQPLLRPINQRFALMLSRIETLERQMATFRQVRVGDRATPSADDGSMLTERVDSLIEAWLRLENKISRLGAQVAEAASDVKNELHAGRTVRLNLGPGRIMNPTCLNVGNRWRPGLDVVAQPDALPFKPRSVDLIFAAQLVEHSSRQDLQQRLLPHWRSLLKPAGRLRIISADDDILSPDCLQILVREAGFAPVRVPLDGGGSGRRFEFELTPELPAAATRS